MTTRAIAEAEILRDQRADEAKEKIRAALAKAEKRGNQRVVRLLQFMLERFFEHGTTITKLKRLARIRDNNVAMLFGEIVGESPHPFFTHRRLDVAKRLLAETDLAVWLIGDVLGFSYLQVFSRSFNRYTGMRPTAFRRENARPKEYGLEDTGRVDDMGRVDNLRLALAGELPDDQAAELIRYLVGVYTTNGEKP